MSSSAWVANTCLVVFVPLNHKSGHQNAQGIPEHRWADQQGIPQAGIEDQADAQGLIQAGPQDHLDGATAPQEGLLLPEFEGIEAVNTTDMPLFKSLRGVE